MKVLVLVESLKVGGGSERFAATLGTKLYDKGYDISYLTLMDESPKYKFKGDYYSLKIDDIYTNSAKRLYNLLKYSPKIKRICNDLEIDTIIAVSEIGNFYAVTSRLLVKNKAHIIATQHMNPEIFLDNKLKFHSIKFFYPKANIVVCVSKETEHILNQVYNISNTQTIYNMVDIQENIKLSQVELVPEYKDLFKEEHFNFINIGRLTRQKGQWFMIRSFKQVFERYPHARLFILGDGPLKEDLEDLITKLDLNNHVFFLGEQDNVFPFLKNGDCFLFPSLWEGLPLVLIEALSMDIPIISSDCKTGPKEILCPELDFEEKPNYPYLGKFAILNEPFPNEDDFNTINEKPLNRQEEKFANLMIEIIKSPNLRKNYSNGKIRAEKFDNDQIVTLWNELLKKLY
ncbi:MAG: glycosyltransferase [Methanobacterium sp.]|jgi:glycosyltransferase involved in cell wall biosynthesis|nr:MAG: glycosyltransferase [Methanobacterium sp.]